MCGGYLAKACVSANGDYGQSRHLDVFPLQVLITGPLGALR